MGTNVCKACRIADPRGAQGIYVCVQCGDSGCGHLVRHRHGDGRLLCQRCDAGRAALATAKTEGR